MSDAPMILVPVPDGAGGTRHEWRPMAVAPRGKGKRRAVRARDPIHANPDSAAQMLKQYLERIERLDEEMAAIAEDKRDVFSEAKAVGFDTKGLRSLLALRKLDPDTRAENEAILDTYRAAINL